MVREMEKIRDDLVLGVNGKAMKMVVMLEKHGYMHRQTVPCTALVVHVDNRSGMMVNPHNVHLKGAEALRVGWLPEKLNESYAMELSQKQSVREQQLNQMAVLVEKSDGRLAPVTKQERYASLSSSHMSQFCKAVGAGCRTDEAQPSTVSTVLALENLQQVFHDEAFAAAVRAGWVSCLYMYIYIIYR